MGLFSNSISEKEFFMAKMELQNDSAQRECSIGLALEERLTEVYGFMTTQMENIKNLTETLNVLEPLEIEESTKVLIVESATAVINTHREITTSITKIYDFKTQLFDETQKLLDQVNAMIKEYEKI